MKMVSRFIKNMERAGYKKTASQGLEEFVSFVEDEELKSRAHHFVADFEKIFYKDKKLSRPEIKNLKSIIEAIERYKQNK
jgi:phage tail tape-measure protein